MIVAVSLIPVDGASSAFVARLLRIVRVLRIITVIPAFRHIMRIFIQVFAKSGFHRFADVYCDYIWAAIRTLIFSETDPDIGETLELQH